MEESEALYLGVPCTEPHDYEVIAKPRLPYGAAENYPGEDLAATDAEALCDGRLAEHTRS